ncbi:sortase [Streptomyces sp. NPDC089919]|uniref:sortase domain-containing protein n=1 Tax=Streptomyces sp. NPDC089919 TaxID=3155188 RepID=UPI0034295FCB
MQTKTRPRPRHRALAGALLAATLTTGGLTACGGGAAVDAADPGVGNKVAASQPATPAARPLAASKPTGLQIPAAGVDATTMLDLTTDAAGELAVPDPDTAADDPGWWTGGVTPGEKGVAVLVAHYDTKHGPALMKNVARLAPGDEIRVPRADGATATFTIREIQDVPKTDFPTSKVYTPTPTPELRLLTCGGPIKDGHRANNVILYASLAA